MGVSSSVRIEFQESNFVSVDNRMRLRRDIQACVTGMRIVWNIKHRFECVLMLSSETCNEMCFSY
jgi:hypothetical protein